jgi:hypothetical protein
VPAVFLDHPELLQDAGLEGRQVVFAFDASLSFTLGFVQRELGIDRSAAGPLPGWPGHLVARDPAAGFEAGPALLVSGTG